MVPVNPQRKDVKWVLGIFNGYSLSQWLNFKLSGITCLVGKLEFKLLSQGLVGFCRMILENNFQVMFLLFDIKFDTLLQKIYDIYF